MRIQRNKFASTTRRVLTATAVSAAVTGISLVTSGTAAASTVLPEKPQESCNSAVHGVIGDTVAITGESVADVVKKGANRAKEILVISELAIWDSHLSGVVADAGMIPVGTVPDADTATVSGEQVASTVIKLLEGEPGLGFNPDKTLGIISETIAKSCELTVFASNYTEPSTSSGAPPAQDGSATTPRTNPAGPNAVPGATAGGTGDATAPRRDYSGIPAVPVPSAGISVPPDLRYAPKASLPQQAPSFDILGQGGKDKPNKDPRVREAGNADALAAPATPERVQLPMLLAVVTLAMVTAALVRTWVLRRTH